MAFTLPNFNKTFGWWPTGTSPVSGPPVLTGNCQLYVHPKPFADNEPGTATVYTPSEYIRLPNSFGNDVGFAFTGSFFSLRDSFGFDWYYIVRWWEYVHLGFPNEYIQASVDQCTITGSIPDTNR